eukprot:9782673-Karenia_brevis.AAC.1
MSMSQIKAAESAWFTPQICEHMLLLHGHRTTKVKKTSLISLSRPSANNIDRTPGVTLPASFRGL